MPTMTCPPDSPIITDVPDDLRLPEDPMSAWDVRPLPIVAQSDSRPMVLVVCRWMRWLLDGKCFILDRDDPTFPIPLVPREGQWMIARAFLEQALEGSPLRAIVPKARRGGCSTIVLSFAYFLAASTPYRNCVLAAHVDDSATKIFKLAKIMHEGCGGKLSKAAESERRIKFPHNSSLNCITGSGRFSGSGDTINFLHVSEAAKFDNTTAQDRKAFASLTRAVAPTSKNSVIVLESSGQGPTGVFPEMCRTAARGESIYKCVFIPWTMDKALSIDEDLLAEGWPDPELKGVELVLKNELGATDGQLEWRRRAIRAEYGGSKYSETPPEFGWDYPGRLEDCFSAKSGRIYPDFHPDRHCLKEPLTDPVKQLNLSNRAFRTRGIDWGGSEHHAFTCIWVWIDPGQEPKLIVDGEACPHFVTEHMGYARDAKHGKRIKFEDDCVDNFRYIVSSFNVTGLVYVYRELWIDVPSEAIHTRVARRIHQMSGWEHPISKDHPDIALYRPGKGGESYQWGGSEGDERFDWRGYGEGVDEAFQVAILAGAGVADRAQYRNCLQFGEWGIPLVPYVKPPGPTVEGAVEDGIAMVNTLISGDTLFHSKPEDRQRRTALRVQDKMDKMRLRGRDYDMTDEEERAWKAEMGLDRKLTEAPDTDDVTGWGSVLN